MIVRSLFLSIFIFVLPSLALGKEYNVKFGPNSYQVKLEKESLVIKQRHTIKVEKKSCNKAFYRNFQNNLENLFNENILKSQDLSESKKGPDLKVWIQAGAKKFILDAKSRTGIKLIGLKNDFLTAELNSKQLCENRDEVKKVLEKFKKKKEQ